jgi:hypothetical protein
MSLLPGSALGCITMSGELYSFVFFRLLIIYSAGTTSENLSILFQAPFIKGSLIGRMLRDITFSLSVEIGSKLLGTLVTTTFMGQRLMLCSSSTGYFS